MKWPELKSFINEVSPKYFEVDYGFDFRIISETEKRIQFTFPQAYRDFLLTIGNDEKFNAFGRAVHDFNFLSARHPSLHYPEYFFCVAHETESDLDNPVDLFIDLRIVTEYDTPLFEYEPYGAFDENRVTKLQLSMMEYFVRQVVLRFEKFNASSKLCYYPEDFLRYLHEHSFRYRFTPSKNIHYLERDNEYVLIELGEQNTAAVFIQIHASDIKEELEYLINRHLQRK